MDMVNLLIKIINLIKKYGIFTNDEFEFFKIDQRPDFYLGVFTVRKKEP